MSWLCRAALVVSIGIAGLVGFVASAAAQSNRSCNRPGSDLIDTSCFGGGGGGGGGQAGGATAFPSPFGRWPSGSDAEARLAELNAALVAGPRRIPATGSFGFYDIGIRNLCGPGSISEAAETFVNQARNAFIVTEKRAVALTVTLTFSGSQVSPNVVNLPLIVLSSDTTSNVIECKDGLVR